jgi:methionyl-tRNA synthetase
MPRKIFVTTALPFANGSLHIGHIMEYIQADIWVRFQRLTGAQIHFIGADDAHGAPIMLKAEKEGISPKQLIDRIAAERPKYLKGFHLSYDNWHTTDSPENVELSLDVYRKLKEAGLIYVKPVEQFFDPVKKMFLADRYIKGECPVCHAKDQYGDACEVCGSVYAPTELINPYSALTGAKPVLKTSDHYFFKLSDPKCVAFLGKWLESEGRLQPQVVNKAREWLTGAGDQKLGDWDISRDAPYFGIAAPDVEQIHFIGKDIIYFHTLFWPAMLHFSGRKVPNHVYVHGFINVGGEKMSKSRGTGLSPLRYLEVGMNPEWLRYYIAAKLNGNVEDIEFNPDDFMARVNSDLVGKYVNIASRTAGFVAKNFGGKLGKMPAGNELLASLQGAAPRIAEYYEQREFGKALREVMAAADVANAYIAQHAPWELAKDRKNDALLHEVCTVSINVFRLLTLYLKPVMPETARAVEKFLGIEPLKWAHASALLQEHAINPYTHLMNRVDAKQIDALIEAPPEPETKAGNSASIEDFSRLDLRVAKVLAAEAVEGSNKLLKLTLDLGKEQRTVFSGIQAAYKPQDIVGRMVVVIANLEPRKMRFGTSEGMVLCASPDDGPSVFLLSVDSGATPGMKVT